MASAGLLRILHSGLQDERLLPPKGQPRTDVFKTAYVRAGRFTTEWVQVDFDNQPAFGSTAKATLPRRGHLITRAFLVTNMPDISTPQKAARAWCAAQVPPVPFVGPTYGWTNSIGHALIQQTQFLIGASAVDTLDGRLMEILDEFHTPLEKVTTVNRLLGRYDSGFSPESNGYNVTNQQVVTPLPFWFARGDPSDAFPIDAVGTDAVQLAVTFNPLTSLYTSTSRSINSTNQQIIPPIQSPFYYTDPTGKPIYGLEGDPAVATNVSEVPGISMALNYNIKSAYLLIEYIYLDKPEANRIRLGDLSYPIVQHYAINPYMTNGAPSVRIPMRIPNPTREIYFMCHRSDADLLNAPFLATRDLSAPGGIAPWWPDASGLNTKSFLPLVPAYPRDSEPITSLSLTYEGRLIRYATDAPALFRSILSSYEQRKTPWHHKYYYHLPFGTQHENFGLTNFMGHANLDKIPKIELALNFKPFAGSVRVSDVPSYTVYIWAETYAILRVYGGRAGLLFGY